jgi:Flp pilus assembly protein TadG
MAKTFLTRKRRGLELIEAAIAFPLLILIVFGVVEYGWFFLEQEEVTDIARQVARVAAVPGGNYEGTFAALQTAAGSQYSSLAITQANNVGGTPGSILYITVSMPYVKLTGGPLIPTPSSVSATVSMANEGP